MSQHSESDSHPARSEVAGVFKSAGMSLQKLNPATQSAVSDVSVDRAFDEERAATGQLPVPAESLPVLEPVPAVAEAAAVAEKVTEDLQNSMSRVDAAVLSIQARQAELEESFQKAEVLLADINRASAALNMDDSLRKRIEATIRRTQALRGNLK